MARREIEARASVVVHDEADGVGASVRPPSVCLTELTEAEAMEGLAEGDGDASLADAYDLGDPHQLGELGEEVAARYLEAHGYDVVARNWRCRHGEVDIVAETCEETVLVEVKTRLGAGADPLEAVVGHKQRTYRALGLAYLMEHDDLESVRFDVIGINVIRPGVARLRHLIGAYQWDS